MPPADRAAFLAYSWGARVARAIPPPVGLPLARRVGGALAPAFRGRRAQVERNLVRIHGPMPRSELRSRVRRTFENYGRYWYEFFRLSGESPAHLLERVDTKGYEHLEAAIAAGTGAIVVVPHLAGYDIAGAWVAAHGMALTVVVESVEPPELFEWFVAQRSAFGMEVVPLGSEAGAAVAGAIEANRAVALVADRDLTGDGVDVELFGERTTMPAGPALLAFRTGAPLFPAAVYFGPEGTLSAVMEPAIPVERAGRLRDDVARVTQAIAHRFEHLIRVAPEQWFVLQPNWPSDRDRDGA